MWEFYGAPLDLVPDLLPHPRATRSLRCFHSFLHAYKLYPFRFVDANDEDQGNDDDVYFWGSPGVPCIPLYVILLYARIGLLRERLLHVKRGPTP